MPCQKDAFLQLPEALDLPEQEAKAWSSSWNSFTVGGVEVIGLFWETYQPYQSTMFPKQMGESPLFHEIEVESFIS